MSELSIRIFESVKGDPAAIQSLAAAIAQNDSIRVSEILAGKGVVLAPSEVASVMSAAAAHDQANMTFTFTFT